MKTSLRPSPDALLDLKNDSSFKALFTADTEDSNNALRDFISTILNREVVELQLMPNEPPVEIIRQNQMSFDVSAKFNDGERVDLELQCRNRDYDYASRAEIQVARLLSTNNRKGDNWKTPPSYQISVLNFHYSNDDYQPLEWYNMRRDDGKKLADKLNVIFFDLLKIQKLVDTPPEKLTKLEKWGLFLSYANDIQQKEYIESLVKSEEGLMSAKSSLLTVSQDEINWAIENSIHTAICDYNTQMINLREKEKRALERGMAQGLAQGIERGMAQGIEQGMAQGIEQGMAQGIEQGMAQGKLLAYFEIIKAGLLSPKEVAEKLGISEKEIARQMNEVDLQNKSH